MTSTAAAPATPLPIARNYLGGAFVGHADSYLDVLDPSDGSVISRVPVSSGREVDAAVRAASAPFPAWSATPIKERVQVLYRYRALLEQHLEELATLITREHGKIRSDAEAEVLKAIELTEFACSMPQIVTGEILNAGVPVPREPFSFGGWNESKFGVGDITGHGSIEFWTRTKTTTTKWNREAGTNWMS